MNKDRGKNQAGGLDRLLLFCMQLAGTAWLRLSGSHISSIRHRQKIRLDLLKRFRANAVNSHQVGMTLVWSGGLPQDDNSLGQNFAHVGQLE